MKSRYKLTEYFKGSKQSNSGIYQIPLYYSNNKIEAAVPSCHLSIKIPFKVKLVLEYSNFGATVTWTSFKEPCTAYS